MKKVIIATRNSELALYQANWVGKQLESKGRISQYELLQVDNLARTHKDSFIKKCEEALLAEEAHIAVHSAKDVVAQPRDKLSISAYCERKSPLDVLILADKHKQKSGFEKIPSGIKIGTSSPRRRLQILKYQSDLQVVELQGNIGTRIESLHKDFDGIILAAAGLERLNKKHLISYYFSPLQMVPSAGQGALAIQHLTCENELSNLVSSLNHNETFLCVSAERHFCRCLGADCDSPVGAYAFFENNTMRIYAMAGDMNSGEVVQTKVSMNIPADKWSLEFAELCGKKAADDLIKQGADKMLTNNKHKV